MTCHFLQRAFQFWVHQKGFKSKSGFSTFSQAKSRQRLWRWTGKAPIATNIRMCLLTAFWTLQVRGSRSRVLRQASQVETIWPQCPHQSSLVPKPRVKLTEDKTFAVIAEINKHQIKPAVKRIRDTDVVKAGFEGKQLAPGYEAVALSTKLRKLQVLPAAWTFSVHHEQQQ